MKTAQRNIGLDVLRAAAIAMVFLVHGVTLTGIPVLAQFGTGVDLFLVLSGFLIGRIYFKANRTSDFSLGGFWVARWWRTLPPYFAAVLLYEIVRVVFADRHMTPLAWYYGFFLQNYLGVHGFGPSWSLCVEEHFYLTLPVVALLAERLLGRRSFRYLLPCAFFLPTVFRVVTLLRDGTLTPDWYWVTHFHCEGLVAGVWLAYLFIDEPDFFARLKRPARWLLPLAPAVLFVLPLWTSRTLPVNVFVFTVLAVGYTAWVRALYDLEWTPAGVSGRMVHQTVRGLALCSYSIYLTHTILFEPLRGLTADWPRGSFRTSAILAGALLGGVIFYYLIERTAIVTRDRFLRRAGSPAAVPRMQNLNPLAQSSSRPV